MPLHDTPNEREFVHSEGWWEQKQSWHSGPKRAQSDFSPVAVGAKKGRFTAPLMNENSSLLRGGGSKNKVGIQGQRESKATRRQWWWEPERAASRHK